VVVAPFARQPIEVPVKIVGTASIHDPDFALAVRFLTGRETPGVGTRYLQPPQAILALTEMMMLSHMVARRQVTGDESRCFRCGEEFLNRGAVQPERWFREQDPPNALV
jgi:hypothetical protein